LKEPALGQVGAALGLGDGYRDWLADLEAIGPLSDPVSMPDRRGAGELLRRAGCSPAGVTDVLDSLPDPERDPEIWWLLERCAHLLVRDMGDPDAARGSWPQLPAALGPKAGCFYFHLFLAVVGATWAFHRSKGVPEEVSWATLSDLGRHEAIHRSVVGLTGIDEPWWMTLHLRGIIFEVGRLQYTVFRLGVGPEHPRPWYDQEAAERLGEGFRHGDAALGVHIPSGDPLTAERCQASFEQARSFFETCFPVPGRRLATFSSWLLDDQLEEYLTADSNIVRFGRAFHRVPGWGDGDSGVLTFVFRAPEADLDELPQETTLQRAVVAHLRAGRHFHWRSGWRDLP
jgi:hypothetical protein